MDAQSREEELFAAALNLPSNEREGYLSRACEDAPSLQSRIGSLLRIVDSRRLRQNPPLMTMHEFVGDHIDNYRLLEEIGSGGCGVVYLAEQVAPVRREVALKIISLGMNSADVTTRFEVERQVLALMDHPNIAKVHDAGSTASGRPYFVMELVRGIKITDYCNQIRLPVAERVTLFMQVCQAIQHAHHKAIVHRDIKPSNILVTLVDGAPVVKVIDFGIAKATQGRLTEETLLTAMEQFVGTPAYVSPEQTEPGNVRVDTRSDIYSLGVLLYELLTSCRPFDSDQTSLTAFASLRERIRSEEPIRPSVRVANAERLEDVAQLYRVSPKRLIQQVQGDLDWIVLRCLEKEPARRYQTASSLWNDLQQFLRNWPIAARPRGLAYAMGKFVRRHRAAVTTVMIILLVVFFSALTTTYMAVQAKSSRELAQDINEFLRNTMFPKQHDERPQTLGDLIYAAGQERGSRVSNVPLSEAAIRQVLGSAYMASDRLSAASWQFQRALAIYRAEIGPDDLRTIAAAGALVRSLSLQGDYRQAEAEAAAAFATIASRGLYDPKRIAFATALAFYRAKQGKFAAAKNLLEPYLAREERMHLTSRLEELEAAAISAPEWTGAGTKQYRTAELEMLEIMAILAPIYAREGDALRAETFARTIVAVRRLRLGAHDPQYGQALELLADVYAEAGSFGLAKNALMEARAADGKPFPPKDADIAVTSYTCRPKSTSLKETTRPWGAEDFIGLSGIGDQLARMEFYGDYLVCSYAPSRRT